MDFLSPFHLILIILIIALLFGGKKIPEMMKGIGEGVREFKKASLVDGESGKKESGDNISEIKGTEKKE